MTNKILAQNAFFFYKNLTFIVQHYLAHLIMRLSCECERHPSHMKKNFEAF